MDVITAIKLYINKMTNESGPGMKIILMDKETVSGQRKSITNIQSTEWFVIVISAIDVIFEEKFIPVEKLTNKLNFLPIFRPA